MDKHKWTYEEVEFLKSNIVGTTYKDLVEMFNKRFKLNLTYGQIRSYLKNHGLRNGRDTTFQKGHDPICPIKKGQRIGVETQFKKGNKSHNWVPIGTERIKPDGYVYVKVQDGKLNRNWKQKHKLIWETANGPVPKGHYVMFADGNRENITIENLILVSQAEMLIMNKNSLIYEDPDLTKTGALIATVINKGSKRKKSL